MKQAGRRAAGVARTRRNLLTAARRHLIEAGYHGLSLEQVADDADVTRVTIYRRFGSKRGLLEAVADDLADRSQVVPRMTAAAATPGATAAFHAVIAETCRFWSSDPDLIRRLVGLAAVDPGVRDVIDDRELWRYEQIAAVVRRLEAERRLRPPFDAEHATVAIGAMTCFPTCDAIATRLGRDLADLRDLLISMLGGVVRLD